MGGSAFRVGDDIDLKGVLMYLSMLIFVLAVIESFLHRIERRAQNNKKSKEILGKVYRELMILGIISFVSVLFAEVGVIDKNSAHFLEFEAAHLAVFFTAVMLTIQAVCIYFTLQLLGSSQVHLEKMNLTTFLDYVNERKEKFAARFFLKRWYEEKKTEQQMIFKVFRSYFMSVHRLPVLFPFSKYLKWAQDNQVSMMIQIEPIIWIVHILLWWLMFVIHSELEKVFGEEHDTLYSMIYFTSAVLLLVFAHFAIIYFLSKKTDELLAVAGCSSKSQLAQSIEMYAWKEQQMLECETQISQTDMLLKQMKQQRTFHKNNKLLAERENKWVSKFPSIGRMLKHPKVSSPPKVEQPAVRVHTMPCLGNHSPPSSPRSNRPSVLKREQPVDIKRHMKMYFRPDTIQEVLKILLLANAFFQAFYMVGFLHMTWQNFHNPIGAIMGLLFPLAVLLNACVLQPYLLQQTLVLGSIWAVNSAVIGKILDEMMDSVLMKEELGKRIYLRLQANGQDIDQLMEMLKDFDENNDGCIDEEEMKMILPSFELHLSSFRFKALVVCLQRGTGKIHYEDLYHMVKKYAERADPPPLITSTRPLRTAVSCKPDLKLHIDV